MGAKSTSRTYSRTLATIVIKVNVTNHATRTKKPEPLPDSLAVIIDGERVTLNKDGEP